MLKGALLICRKDLALTAGRGGGLVQALLLGLLLIFIFSLTRAPGEVTSPQAAAAIFWVSSLFCQVLLFTALYGLEESDGQRQALLLAPLPAQSVWLGKALAGLALLALAQLVFLPASVIFLDQSWSGTGPGAICSGLGLIFLTDLGLAALGSLLGALAQSSSGSGGLTARESLFSILAFPLLLPLLLAGIRTGAALLGAAESGGADFDDWVKIILACDAVFIGLGLLLFGFVYDTLE